MGTFRSYAVVGAVAVAATLAGVPAGPGEATGQSGGGVAVLPQDGRGVYTRAFDAARSEIRIEICVLEDPIVLRHLARAIARGVTVRAIVDNRKYRAFGKERANLARYVTSRGGRLHLSNPVFPRSFPKVILIDRRTAIVGSACLDSTTFASYRDYAYVTRSRRVLADLSRLFENDWRYSRPPGLAFPAFNPTPATSAPELLVAPLQAAGRLAAVYRGARRTLDVTSEILGNRALEAELAAAAARGVRVRLIAPRTVNKGSAPVQRRQARSLALLASAGAEVHVTAGPQSRSRPYMHARTAIADGRVAYLGSISLSPDSATSNREVGLLIRDRAAVRRIGRQFALDFTSGSAPVADAFARTAPDLGRSPQITRSKMPRP